MTAIALSHTSESWKLSPNYQSRSLTQVSPTFNSPWLSFSDRELFLEHIAWIGIIGPYWTVQIANGHVMCEPYDLADWLHDQVRPLSMTVISAEICVFLSVHIIVVVQRRLNERINKLKFQSQAFTTLRGDDIPLNWWCVLTPAIKRSNIYDDYKNSRKKLIETRREENWHKKITRTCKSVHT